MKGNERWLYCEARFGLGPSFHFHDYDQEYISTVLFNIHYCIHYGWQCSMSTCWRLHVGNDVLCMLQWTKWTFDLIRLNIQVELSTNTNVNFGVVVVMVHVDPPKKRHSFYSHVPSLSYPTRPDFQPNGLNKYHSVINAYLHLPIWLGFFQRQQLTLYNTICFFQFLKVFISFQVFLF